MRVLTKICIPPRNTKSARPQSLLVVGPRATDVVATCLPTALMFFGVYCTTAYELMMVLVSTHALRTGSGAIPWTWERALHLDCVGAGAAALLGYYLRCRAIELDDAALVAEAGAAHVRAQHGGLRAAGATVGLGATNACCTASWAARCGRPPRSSPCTSGPIRWHGSGSTPAWGPRRSC